MPVDLDVLLKRRKRQDRVFAALGLFCLFIALLTLSALLLDLSIDGLRRIDRSFFMSFPSRFAGRAGILSAWVGTLALMCVTASFAIPLGIAAAIYLEEYAKKNWFRAVIEINISNLAGVPSIVYGLMALGLLVNVFRLGQSVLTGGITLGLLVLPIVIVATREALRSVPIEMREAAAGVGATRWQVIWHHLLPYSASGISTGIIIALSRAVGETAPLITIGALTFIAFLPPSPVTTEVPFVSDDWLWSPFTALPIQMFNWVSRPGDDFHANAAATGLILVLFTLGMNAFAIAFRYRVRKKIKW